MSTRAEGTPALALFFLFPLSPLVLENTTMSSQVCAHQVLIFSGATAYFLFRDDRWTSLALALVMSFLAVLSFGIGVAATAGICAVYVLSQLRRLDRGAILRIVIVLLGHAAFYVLFLQLTKSSGGSVSSAILRLATWEYFLGLVTFGLGLLKTAGAFRWVALVGVVFLAALFYPFVIGRERMDRRQWTWLAWIAGILCAALLIAIGRHPLGLAGAKSSRYFELVSLLVPLGAFVWSDFLRDRPLARKKILVGYWAVVFVFFLDNLSFRPYRRNYEQRMAARECAKEIFAARTPERVCPTAHPSPLLPYLEKAERLKLSFLRTF